MTSPDHPRVLVVSHNPFDEERNNGLTMSSLFRGWPRERLAQVYFPFATPIAPYSTVCERFWAVTPADVLQASLGRPRDGTVVPGEREAAPMAVRSPRLRAAVQALARSQMVRDLAEPLRDALYSAPGVLSAPLRRWVRDFRPDVVYSTLGSVPCMRVALALADETGAALVPHFTDDWPSTLYAAGPGLLLRPRMRRWLATVNARSTVRLVISDAMREEYARRYAGAGETFASVAEATRFDPTPRDAGDGVVRLTYIGGLHLDRWRSLAEIGAALLELRREGVEATLDVYTFPDHTEAYARHFPATVRMAGWVPNSEVPRVVQQSDVLVHVESFVAEIARYTRFSMSTKMSEYLLAGRPLLAYGPADAASVAYVGQSGAGLAVGAQDATALRAAVRRLVTDGELRGQLGRAARRVGLERHDATRQRERFCAVLAAAAARNVPRPSPSRAVRAG